MASSPRDQQRRLAATYLALAVGESVVIMDRGPTPSRSSISLSIGRANPAGTGPSIGADHTVSSVALSLSGTPVVGEVWSLPLTVGGVTTTVSYTVALVDADGNPLTPALRAPTLAEVAASLAAAIRASGPAVFSASTEGNTLIVVDESGAAFPGGLRGAGRRRRSGSEPGGPGGAGASLPVVLQGAASSARSGCRPDLAAAGHFGELHGEGGRQPQSPSRASRWRSRPRPTRWRPVRRQRVRRDAAAHERVGAASASVSVLPAGALATTRQDAATTTFHLAAAGDGRTAGS
jgi:hypothetical protein